MAVSSGQRMVPEPQHVETSMERNRGQTTHPTLRMLVINRRLSTWITNMIKRIMDAEDGWLLSERKWTFQITIKLSVWRWQICMLLPNFRSQPNPLLDGGRFICCYQSFCPKSRNISHTGCNTQACCINPEVFYSLVKKWRWMPWCSEERSGEESVSRYGKDENILETEARVLSVDMVTTWLGSPWTPKPQSVSWYSLD